MKSFMAMLHSPLSDEIESAEVNDNMDIREYLEFHASYVGMMNDKRENRLVNDIFKKIPQKYNIHIGISKWAKGLPYAISFCEQKDYLPMWRGYSNDEVGICLGFCRDDFVKKIKYVNADNEKFTLNNCEYLSKSTVRKRRVDTLKKFKEIIDTLDSDGDHRIILRELQHIMDCSAICKPIAFKYEKEVRLIKFGTRVLSPKEGRYGLSLYQEIKMPLSLLKEIIISPFAMHAEMIKYGIVEWLRRSIYSDIVPSEIPIKVELSKFT